MNAKKKKKSLEWHIHMYAKNKITNQCSKRKLSNQTKDKTFTFI